MPPVLVPEFREPLLLPAGERIQFMAIYLLHEDELELKLSGDLDQLFERFGETEVSERFNLSRPSAIA
ncbi:MAG: suppressor of fused domain protein [Bryobacteraceae bacterium]|nr:suppressor of fused domain protein [Bryobacteraceae bacterium]